VVMNVDFLRDNIPEGANAACAQYAQTVKCQKE
jgi:hypothetical protein